MKTFLYVVTLLMLCVSCKEDESKVDIREQVVGEYSYSGKSYQITGPSKAYLSSEDVSGTLIVFLDSTNATGLIIKEINSNITRTFKAENVNNSSEGIVFDVPDQTVIAGNGSYVTVTKYEGYSTSGKSTLYSGGYNKSTKSLTFYWSIYDYVLVSSTVMELKGKK